MNLEQLKAQNAAEEAAENDAVETLEAQSDEVSNSDEAENNLDSNDSAEAQSGDDEGGDEAQEKEAWLSDEDSSMPVKTHIAMKQRLKGTIREQNSELDDLKKEIMELKGRGQQQQQAQQQRQRMPVAPRYEDFETDESFRKAEYAYMLHLQQLQNHKMQAQQAEQAQQAKVLSDLNSAVDAHFERAAKVIEENGIEPERFQQADSRVRRVVDSVMPEQGEVITDALIASLGEGSEKVMYFIGNNEGAQNKLASLLREDPNGIKAAIYLGQLKAEKASARVVKKSNAPAPAASANGGSSSTNEASLKRKYDNAKTPQERYNLRKQAKQQGADVKSW